MRTRTLILAAAGIVIVAGLAAVTVFYTRAPGGAAVRKRPLQPVISFVALPWSDGKSATLAWNVRNADRVTIAGEDVPVEGTKTVPLRPTRYELTATGAGGSAQSSVELAAPDQPDGAHAPAKPAGVQVEAVKQGPIRVDPSQLEGSLVNKVAPRYPDLARNAHVQGTVRFQATIGTDGGIKGLKLVAGHPLLVAAAAEALRQWRYKPISRGGHPVEVLTEIDVRFTLSQ